MLTQTKNLQCSKIEFELNDNHFDVGNLNMCIVILGKVTCPNSNFQMESNISNIIKVRVGTLTSCSLTEFKKLNCWGPNVLIKDFPVKWKTDIIDFSVGNYNQSLDLICVITCHNEFACLYPNGKI